MELKEWAMRTCRGNVHEEGTRVAGLVNDLKAFFCTLEIGVIQSVDIKSISDVKYHTAGHPTGRMPSAALQIQELNPRTHSCICS